MRKNIFATIIMTTGFVVLGGCAATNTALEHRNLETTTKMSETVFLDPSEKAEPSIYLSVKNTTDQSGLENEVRQKIETSLTSKGYRVVKGSRNADYMLQANLLKIGKTNPDEVRLSLNGGFGSAISGAAVGATLSALTNQSNRGVVVGGLAGGAASMVADALVKDVMYSLVTDIQISERPSADQKVQVKSHSKLKQGQSTTQTVESSGGAKWIRYRTRVVSTAEKVNLKFAQAEPMLVQDLSQSVAGIF